MISRSPQDLDFYVFEACRFLREDLEAYGWMPKETLIRRVACTLEISYAKAGVVVDDLADMNVLEWNYGKLRVRHSSFST